ncbi:hypothetical protein [Capnocytophaga leadbetteri]
MKTSNKTPRALSQELGIKLSDWTHNVTSYFDICDDKQEQLFAIIRSTEDPDIINTPEEKATIRDVLSYMLSLSFIVLREKQQIDEFFEDYNGFL